MGNLVEHAKRELELAGLFDKDSDYNGESAKSVMALMEVFAEQGHSGASAGLVLHLFTKVASFKTISPLTYEKGEWNDISEKLGKPTWQNKRNPAVFSEDQGKTHFNIDD